MSLLLSFLTSATVSVSCDWDSATHHFSQKKKKSLAKHSLVKSLQHLWLPGEKWKDQIGFSTHTLCLGLLFRTLRKMLLISGNMYSS